jgi:hypothetical protein
VVLSVVENVDIDLCLLLKYLCLVLYSYILVNLCKGSQSRQPSHRLLLNLMYSAVFATLEYLIELTREFNSRVVKDGELELTR